MKTAVLTNAAAAKTPPAAPSGSVSLSKLVRSANRWREQYNPLRGLTLARAVALLELEDRGEMADLQWLYRAVERADADLLALVQRRAAALLEMDWNVQVVARDKRASGFDLALATDQAAALRAAYEGVDNIYEAVAHLALATFRGYAHCELWRGADGGITHLEPVMQWNVVRDGLAGGWRYNPEGRQTTFAALPAGMDLDPANFLVVEAARPVDRVGLLKFVRGSLAEKDWDAWVEIYGLPGVIIIGPPNVPPDKEAQYESAARDVAEGGSGYLPNGASATPNDGPRNSSPFKERLDHLTEKLILAGTGGKLTMLSAPTGLGSGTSDAHGDVFRSIARGEARRISEAFQRRMDLDVLGRKFPGKPALAYFALAANEETQVGDIVEHVLKLRQAGLAADPSEVSERTGYRLSASALPEKQTETLKGPAPKPGADPAVPPDPSGPDALPNRAPVLPAAAATSPEEDAGSTARFLAAARAPLAQALATDLQPLSRALADALHGDDTGTGGDLATRLETLRARLPELRARLAAGGGSTAATLSLVLGPALVDGLEGGEDDTSAGTVLANADPAPSMTTVFRNSLARPTALANKAPAGSSTPFALPTDGWFHLAPLGEFPHPTGVVQVIDEPAVDSMVARFAAEMPGGFPGLLVDYEHRSHEPDGSTEAAAWVEGLEKRQDGLWGQLRWSDDGRAAVAGGRYRFQSPTWLQPDCEWVGENRLRPLRLHDCGLTNSPNLTGLVPLSNRQAAPAAGNPQQATTTAEDPTTHMANPDYKAQLTEVLGLPATATDEQISAARPTLLANRDKGAKYDALKTEHEVLLNSQADSDLAAAGVTDDEEKKEWKGALLENRTRTLKLLANAAKSRGNQAAATLTNRATAKTPGQGGATPAATTTAPDPAAAGKSQLQLQREAIDTVKLANKGTTHEAAYQLAKRTHPDLFKPAPADA